MVFTTHCIVGIACVFKQFFEIYKTAMKSSYTAQHGIVWSHRTLTSQKTGNLSSEMSLWGSIFTFQSHILHEFQQLCGHPPGEHICLTTGQRLRSYAPTKPQVQMVLRQNIFSMLALSSLTTSVPYSMPSWPHVKLLPPSWRGMSFLSLRAVIRIYPIPLTTGESILSPMSVKCLKSSF
jgi:hypothetical protein